MSARRKEVEIVSLHKILGWIAGIVASLLVAGLTASVASLYGRLTEVEHKQQQLEVAKAGSDATGNSLIDRLTKIEIKLDDVQRELLLQRKK